MRRKILLFFLLMLSFNIFSRVCVHTNQNGLACIDRMNGNNLLPMLHSKQPAHTIIRTGQEDYEITKPGSYQILENVVSTNIIIKSDNVILDLNNFTIEHLSNDVIKVDSGFENIVIKNGSIVGEIPYEGVEIGQGAKGVRLENLRISGCDKGIYLNGSGSQLVEYCHVINCLITNCDFGVLFSYSNKNIFKDVEVCDCQYSGISLGNSKYNKLYQCKAIRIGPAQKVLDGGDYIYSSALGFSSWGGVDNLFYECMAEGIYKDEANSKWCTKAMGFLFGYERDFNGDIITNAVAETESKIVNCTVDSITSAGLSNAFGINLEMRLLDEMSSVFADQFDGTINDVDWSPQGEFIALACQDNSVRVLKFDGTELKEVHTILSVNSNAVKAVKWSPDGQHLAVGTEGGLALDVVYSLTGECGVTSGLVTLTVATESDKELFVYKFDRSILTLVDSRNVGENQVPVFSTLASLVTLPSGTIIPPSGTTPPNQILPGVDPCPVTPDTSYAYIPTLAETGALPDNILRIIWSRDGKSLFVTTGGLLTPPGPVNPTTPFDYTSFNFLGGQELPKLINYFFDGDSLTQVQRKIFTETTNTSLMLALSPDDKFLTYGRSNAIPPFKKIYVSKFTPLFGVLDVLSSDLVPPIAQYTDIPFGADWNPVASCGKYYLAVVGNYDPQEVGLTYSTLEIFEYNSETNTLTRIFSVQVPASSMTDVNWSPNGKNLVVSGSSANLAMYSFDPADVSVLTPLATQLTGASKFVDWAECGKHIVAVGQEDDPNVELFLVGDSVSKCVVENNKIANVAGGICGIGIIGAGSCNLIDKNVLFGNCVNASAGVFNTFYDFKMTNTTFKSKALDNLAFDTVCC